MKIRKLSLGIIALIMIFAATNLMLNQRVSAIDPPVIGGGGSCGNYCYMVTNSTCHYIENGEIFFCGGWYL